MATNHYLVAEGYWHLHHGRTEEALVALENAYALTKNNLLINFHTMETLPALVGALRRHADAVEQRDSRASHRLRKRAFRLARWGAWIMRFFPTHYPYALRELSLILAATGKTKQALQVADKSCALTERQRAKYEHAQSLLVRGRLAHQLGLPEAREQIQTAEAALSVIEGAAQAGSL